MFLTLLIIPFASSMVTMYTPFETVDGAATAVLGAADPDTLLDFVTENVEYPTGGRAAAKLMTWSALFASFAFAVAMLALDILYLFK